MYIKIVHMENSLIFSLYFSSFEIHFLASYEDRHLRVGGLVVKGFTLVSEGPTAHPG